MPEPIHQFLYTSCTAQTSVWNRRGYSVRATSMDLDETGDVLRTVERHLSYALPSDVPANERTRLDSAAAPRKLACLTVGSRLALAHICHRPYDEFGRAGSLFAHVLLIPSTRLAVWETLYGWNGPHWITEDSPDLPLTMPVLDSWGAFRGEWADGVGGMIREFLLGEPRHDLPAAGPMIPAAWMSLPATARRALAADLTGRLLSSDSGRRRILLAAPPAFAALLFCIALRVAGHVDDVPGGVVVYSTYEARLAGEPPPLSATWCREPHNLARHLTSFPSRAVINTFHTEPYRAGAGPSPFSLEARTGLSWEQVADLFPGGGGPLATAPAAPTSREDAARTRLRELEALAGSQLPRDQLYRRITELVSPEFFTQCPDAAPWRQLFEEAQRGLRLVAQLEHAVRKKDDQDVARLAREIPPDLPLPAELAAAAGRVREREARIEHMLRCLDAGDANGFRQQFDSRCVRESSGLPARKQRRLCEGVAAEIRNQAMGQPRLPRVMAGLTSVAGGHCRLKWSWPPRRVAEHCLVGFTPEVPPPDASPEHTPLLFRRRVSARQYEEEQGVQVALTDELRNCHVLVWGEIDLGFEVLYSRPVVLGRADGKPAGSALPSVPAPVGGRTPASVADATVRPSATVPAATVPAATVPAAEPTCRVPPPSWRDDFSFSSQSVVAYYPAPIAAAFRRFCAQKSYHGRWLALVAATEAAVRYLVTLGVSDLCQSLARAEVPRLEVLEGEPFTFLHRKTPMTLGRWVGALGATAAALRGASRRLVEPFPQVCAPQGHLVANVLATILQERNRWAHASGSVVLTESEAERSLQLLRPALEEALQQIRFVCQYPLGFFHRLTPEGDRSPFYAVHSCMGARIANTVEAVKFPCDLPLPVDLPFVATPGGTAILLLWPLLLQRVSEWNHQHTLYAFETVDDRPRSRWLGKIHAAAINLRDDIWSYEARSEGVDDGAWLLERLRAFQSNCDIPLELELPRKLTPCRGKLVGRRLGPYLLKQLLAVGGYGTVYLGQTDAGEPVAVKVIESEDAVRQLSRFEKEFDKLTSLRHPGIVTCYERGREILDGQFLPWYSMEFAMGGDLSTRIDERGPTPWRDAERQTEIVREFEEVLESVAHLHRLAIVHRDIKPSNVLIRGDGALQLSDFGLVKSLQPSAHSIQVETSRGAVLGTPQYMAPEQQQGGEVSAATDVYALGIMLAELTTGERPQASPRVSQGSTLQHVVSLRTLPDRLRRLILQCTDVDTSRRPADAQDLLRQWRTICGDLREGLPRR